MKAREYESKLLLARKALVVRSPPMLPGRTVTTTMHLIIIINIIDKRLHGTETGY